MSNSKIIVFTDWFTPGFRAGGPIRSTVNFVDEMERQFDIWVVTGNKDLGAAQSYEGINADQWVSYSKRSSIWYASEKTQNLQHIRGIIEEVQPDFCYLNSMFSKVFTIYPLLLLWQKKTSAKVILSPRGMLKDSALSFKPLKKKIFLQLIKSTGLPKKLCFHATNQEEKEAIQHIFGNETSVFLAPNFPQKVGPYPEKKVEGPYEFCFVGRIHPIKGLDTALEALKNISVPLTFNIIGSLEDKKYWEYCQSKITALPENIKIRYKGEMRHKALRAFLISQHFFISPTHGENFGHAIFEALAVGLPVLISDQTPWRDLERQKVGWDLALDDQQGFVDALEKAARMDQKQYAAWSHSAWQYARNYVNQSNLKQQYLKLFSQNV